MNAIPETSSRSSSPSARLRLAILLLLLVVLAGSYPTLRRWIAEEEGERHPAVGKKINEIHFHPLDTGEAIPPSGENLAGKVVLVNYWGTWCFPCRLELPHLAELHEQWRDETNLRFFFVSCEDQLSLAELTEKTLDFLEREGHDKLPVYADPGQASRRHLADVAGFGDGFSYPTTIILDGEQRIRGIWRGYRAEDTNEQAALLKRLMSRQK